MPRIFQRARDPISSYTHFIGAALSLVGLAAMVIELMLTSEQSPLNAVSCILFCLSLIALYSASGVYHFSRAAANVLVVLRKLDHAMIYVLIAGTYTPLLLTLLPAPHGAVFTAVIWAVALAGIVMKLCWINAPRWLGTTLYLLLGWAIAIDLPALAALPVPAVALLAAGGLLYTAGGLIYMVGRPNLSERFGFHELFHLFVIAGSVCHYFLVLLYIA
ncbi:PAQR family membrane homeostasis protein TrhA [Anaerotruncus colihominis]|jgi:hemolysin III|uniref:Hemolysin III family protein n=1 Tax=Anaerotruncus colihominis TaxID=169435 RepID=A0A845SZC6_9FIRM|nr:hemolysin III family protein [Anaerotruncus colihominis]MCR2024523.1 hemolysin III family protein [Anaerotruncus colihominis]NDO39884.1 hemolysin III family protein [Anaerotruncus colihominis]